MDVLLSIKPQYVNEIANGNKRFEFRKALFRDPAAVDNIYIYSTSPVKRITGRFKIGEIIERKPKTLWNQCKKFSGISEGDFFEYFENKETGFAIRIKDFVEFKKPINPIEIFPKFSPPQSYFFIEMPKKAVREYDQSRRIKK